MVPIAYSTVNDYTRNVSQPLVEPRGAAVTRMRHLPKRMWRWSEPVWPQSLFVVVAGRHCDASQVREPQIRPVNSDACHVGASQVRVTQVGVLQVCRFQVRAD